MKTCISTYSYKRLIDSGEFTHFDAIDYTKKLGMDGVELQFSVGFAPEGQTQLEYVKSLTEYAHNKGLDVPMYTIGANLYCVSPDEEIQRVCSHVDIAAACGIPKLRFDVTAEFLGMENAKTPYVVIKTVAPYIRHIAEYAATKGVMVCSENHGRLIQDSLRVEQLIAEVNHSNYRWLCDMGNFGGVDEDCALAVSRVIHSICYVHAKDNFTRNGMMYDPGRGFARTRAGSYRRQTIFGHGDVPTFQILSALHLAGYDGYVSIEFEGIEENLLALEIGSENLKRMLKELRYEDFDKKWQGS